MPDYKRYRNTDSGVSPMAIPGTPGVVYTADGLEHSEAGIPSSQSRDHRMQLDKRERKLLEHDYGRWWADIDGDGERRRHHLRLGDRTRCAKPSRAPRQTRRAGAA